MKADSRKTVDKPAQKQVAKAVEMEVAPLQECAVLLIVSLSCASFKKTDRVMAAAVAKTSEATPLIASAKLDTAQEMAKIAKESNCPLVAQAESVEADSLHKPVAKSPAPGTIFLYPERIPLKDGGFFNAERGMMFVPVNRSKKNSAVIAVEVYRFKRSEKANPETPPIFYLHGGPSFGGL